MFLPVVLDFENNGLKFMLLKYLRFFDMCIKNDWAIISHEEFEKYELNFPNRNEYKEQMKKLYSYSLYNYEERKKVKQFFVPKSYYNSLEQKKGSKLESAMYLLNNCDNELEEVLEKYIQEILKNEQIEGILYFAACPLSLKVIASKHNIPLIAYETGPIRSPNYRCTTSYFCREGLYTTEEIEGRYQKFKDSKTEKLPIFTREELLMMFVNDNNLGYVSLVNKTPKYEIGVAGGCAIVVPYFAINKYMDHELVDDVLNLYEAKDILFRLHPGDMYKATYRLPRYDVTAVPFAFLIESKRIAAVGSNLLFEGILWKRIPCSKTKVMPACLMSSTDYRETKEKEDIEEFVNFFVFGFLVPYELAYDPDYLRWRLSNPEEEEIYICHLDFYLKKFGLTKEWLELEPEIRMHFLKMLRKGETIRDDELESKFEFAFPNIKNNIEKVYIDSRNGKQADITYTSDELLKKYQDTQQYLDDILNSNTWKATAPIRKLLDKIKYLQSSRRR